MSSSSTMNAPTATASRPSRLTAGRSLFAGVAAAIGASLCCVAPLVLVLLGIGGAWISYLTVLEPYRPIFIGLTLVFLGLAFRKLYLVQPACAPDGTCVTPRGLRNQRLLFWVISGVLLILIGFPWYAPLFLT